MAETNPYAAGGRPGDPAVPRNRVLDPDLLKAFIAVVDHDGYTAAARVLHRSQAAVSQQIRRLEEVVQAELLQQPRHEIQLTEQGAVLLEYARRLIALNDEALASLHADRVAGRVRIGANNHFVTHVLPPLLAAFCKQHPQVQLEVHTAPAAEMQRGLGHAYDLVISNHPAGAREGHLLQRAQVHWLGALHDSPHGRDPLPLGLLPRGALIRELAVTALAQAGRAWHLAQESSDVALEAAAAAGLAVIVGTHVPPGLRVLGPADGLPPLPPVDIRMQLAQRYLPRAAERLAEYLLERLVPPAG